MTPSIFIGNINESDYPLWGLVLAVIIGGVVIIGMRWRITSSDIGDAGIVLFNIYFGLEWGGGE